VETLESSRVAILEKFLEFGRSRDTAALQAMITEDIRIQQAPSLPFGGVYVGWAGYLEVTEKLFGKMRKVRLELIETWDGPQCSLIAHFMLNAVSKRTREAICMPLLEKWEFKDDKVAAITPFYHDTHLLSRQL
jgi:hypothetical protein